MPEPLSDRLAMFIPLAKADAAQRLVYGYFDETPDRAGEVCDYATARPAFEAWSAEMEKASDGKNLGNIRGQHSNIAAGKLVELTFDDDLKKVGFAAKIVDDNEWRKVEEGVYTGFSPGGKYAKRWPDGGHTRYTPLVRELSIVDVPCNPAATFTLVKADGTEEQHRFVIDKAYEPGNEATKARADEMAKAIGPHARPKDFLGLARAELIAINAGDALAKMAAEAPVEETPPAETPPAEDPAAKLEAELTKAAAIVAAPVDEPKGPFADLAKAAAALELITVENPLTKCLWTIGSLSQLMIQFRDLCAGICWEAKDENDGSAQPAKAQEIVKSIGELLVLMAQEEVAEAIANMPDLPEPVVIIADGDEMELATQIVDLVKADTDLMEKAGARNSKTDAATIQAMHDGAVKLGATCEAEANKAALATVEADRERLAKALGDAAPRVEELAKSLETYRAEAASVRTELAETKAQLEEFSKRAEPAKGKLIVVDKEGDGGSVGEDLNKVAPGSLDTILAMPRGADRDRALDAYTLTARNQIPA